MRGEVDFRVHAMREKVGDSGQLRRAKGEGRGTEDALTE